LLAFFILCPMFGVTDQLFTKRRVIDFCRFAGQLCLA
jgi:hypothetical protein